MSALDQAKEAAEHARSTIKQVLDTAPDDKGTDAEGSREVGLDEVADKVRDARGGQY